MHALIVEDHYPTAEILERVLRRSGHEVTVCGSAEEARERVVRNGAGAFPLCIVDLALPGRDGIWFSRWLRSQPDGERPYLIVGTGSDHSEKLGEAFEAGADDYVEKPYEPRLLAVRFAVAGERLAAKAEQDRLAAALQSEEQLVATVFDTAATCIVALDHKGRIAKANRATSDLTGKIHETILGASFRELFRDQRGRNESIASKMAALADHSASACEFETQINAADGSQRDLAWICRSSAPEPGDEEKPLLVCVGADITVRRELESQLAFLAERDPLTHLLNRSQLDASVQRALDATQNGRSSALLCLDLDDFKIVNDTAGHAAGDALIQSIAHLITRHTRPTDTVIRLGGDEFVVVLPDSKPGEAEAVADRIRHAIEHLDFVFADRSFRVTASVGLIDLHGEMSLEEALGLADAACYASKRNGRNLVTVGNSGVAASRSDDQLWHQRLKDAIAHDAIDLWLQPIVSLSSGQPVFHEVLLRLPGASGAALPGQFLPAARRYNLLQELDRCVVRNALDLLQSEAGLRLTINLSGRSASDPRLPDFLTSAIRRTGVDPGRIVFEITESELISDLPQAIERLSALRSEGFRFALDDFGRGYSSFRYLRELPVEMVKIDGSYTMALAEDPASAAFIRAITSLAHSIGLTCVAEYVEDESVVDSLRHLGVDLGQGYHFGAPRSHQSRPPAKGESRASQDLALAT